MTKIASILKMIGNLQIDKRVKTRIREQYSDSNENFQCSVKRASFCLIINAYRDLNIEVDSNYLAGELNLNRDDLKECLRKNTLFSEDSTIITVNPFKDTRNIRELETLYEALLENPLLLNEYC